MGNLHRAPVVATLLILVGHSLLADVTGAILGQVADPSGAVVAGASVTLSSPSTGLNRHTTSDATGFYQFLAVPVGNDYVVEVAASGFQKAVLSQIKLLVNQSFRADFHLQIGVATQQVQVSAAPVQVETTSTQLGDVIQDKKMTSLPLNGRSYIDLLGLQAGVVPVTSGSSYSNHDVSGDQFAGILSVNGGRETANSFLVNGGDVEESTDNGAAVVPTLDSIQEFRLLTSSFDAEYGRFSGAIVNVITKSGTNEFHGVSYEFVRNDKLDARNFFDRNETNPATGQEIPNSAKGELRRNQFGGTLGGPIVKNKLFFFLDYQGTRQVVGTTSGVISVPSLSERNGNFSDVDVTGYPALTGIVHGSNTPGVESMNAVLSQRLGYTVKSGEPYWVPGCTTLQDALTGMCVFPNQVIPQSAWSPAAKGTLQFIPDPTGTRNGQPFFSTTAFKNTLRDDKGAGRIDLNSRKTGVWSFYFNTDDALVVNPYGGSSFGGFLSTSPTRATEISMSNTRSFGPSAVNEFRASYTRDALRLGAPSGEGLGPVSNYGFVSGGLGIIPSASSLEGVPQISLNLLGFSFGVSNADWQFNNTYQLGDSFSKIVGPHTLKFGAEGRDYQINMRWRYSMNGAFSFSGAETGNDFADFLLGAPDLFFQASPGDLDGRSHYAGAFIEDSYKLRSNFTLDLGFRWEVSQPWADEYDRLQTFVPGEQSQRFPDAPLGWVFAGDPGIPSTVSPTHYLNLEPRVGFAYSPGFSDGPLGKLFGGPGKSSIRAAFGMYTSAFEQISNNFELGNSPFAIYYRSNSPPYLEEPYLDRNGTVAGQRFPYVAPAEGATGFWPEFMPVANEQAWKTDNKLPQTMDMNFTIQRQLSSSVILTTAYVGTLGRHLLGQSEADPGNPASCLAIAAQFAAAGEAGQGCGPFGEDTIYTLPSGQTFYGTRPYSVTSGRYLSQGLLDFGEVPYMTTWGNSEFNSLQTTLEKRAGALTLLAAYTWSKSIDDGSGFSDFENPYNRQLSRALSAFDMTHNFVVSYSYALPFSKWTGGKAKRLFDGWQLAGITRFSTGLPITMVASGDTSLCGCSGADRPNYDDQPITIYNPRDSNNQQYFSTAQFSLPQLGMQGTSATRFFHGPGLDNTDLAMTKTTLIRENISLEFRAEFFNVFNHAQFENPVGDVAASNFGQVTNARDPRIGQLALKLHF